jgi:hypothetical protein
VSKGGFPLDQIAAEIWRGWRRRVERWVGAAGALIVSVLFLLFYALPHHLWRSARTWWRS